MAAQEWRLATVIEADPRTLFGPLADDFDSPRALAAMFALVAEANGSPAGVGAHDLREMLAARALANLVGPIKPAPDVIETARVSRASARRLAYAGTDRLRAVRRDSGWELRDAPGGPELVPVIRSVQEIIRPAFVS